MIPNHFFVDLDGFSDGVFPGVFLLSRWRWSGFPVEMAVRFGPGLIARISILKEVLISGNIVNNLFDHSKNVMKLEICVMKLVNPR